MLLQNNFLNNKINWGCQKLIYALYGCNCRHKVKLIWFFGFCLCRLGNKTFSHTASSEKKGPKGNSPTGTFKDYLTPLRYLADFSPTLFSPIKLKWSVSIWVLFFPLIWDLLNFLTVSCYLQNAECPLCFPVFVCARWDCRTEKSGQSQLVLFLVPLRSLASTPAVFSAAIKGGGPKRVWASPERSMRTSQTPASQSHLYRRCKSINLP